MVMAEGGTCIALPCVAAAYLAAHIHYIPLNCIYNSWHCALHADLHLLAAENPALSHPPRPRLVGKC